MFEDNFISADI